jgi:hypothetical protein
LAWPCKHGHGHGHGHGPLPPDKIQVLSKRNSPWQQQQPLSTGRHLLGVQFIFFFLFLFFTSSTFSLLIGWQLSNWICCKPFYALLYNCQLLCFW